MNKVYKKKYYDTVQIIKRAGLSVTEPRCLLLSFLHKKKYPLTIQKIANGLKNHKINQVTIYRIIDIFKHAGVVREINLHGERSRYEIADSKHNRHHIVCTRCHKLENFIGCDYQKLKKNALNRSRYFSKITGHSFELYGLCNKCMKTLSTFQ